MTITENMSIAEKPNILFDAAKYDVACTSVELTGRMMERALKTA